MIKRTVKLHHLFQKWIQTQLYSYDMKGLSANYNFFWQSREKRSIPAILLVSAKLLLSLPIHSLSFVTLAYAPLLLNRLRKSYLLLLRQRVSFVFILSAHSSLPLLAIMEHKGLQTTVFFVKFAQFFTFAFEELVAKSD